MGKVTLQPTDGFILHGWMVTELHLSGGDLIAFALVYQFTQSKAGVYKGGASYLSAWTGWTLKTSRGHLSNLVRLGYIKKVSGREDNSPTCHYSLTDRFYEKHGVKITPSQGKNYPLQEVKITSTIGKKLPTENNIEYNIENNTPPTPSRGRTMFVKPSVEEVAAYCAERHNNIDPEAFVDLYESKGWKVGSAPMKDWKAAVRTWEKRHHEEVQTAKTETISTDDFITRLTK